jgi:TetR/AcrR family transcriptional repressor of nem operon
MARTLNEEEYAIRRKEILDGAQRLVYAKGFDQMTIQDILNEVQISKGALYHYFGSKADLLEALVERMVDEIEPALIAVVENENLSGLEKLQRYLDTAVRWKTARKSMLLSLLRVWYADENAIVRQKVFASTVARITPWITRIIEQGVREGTFTTHYPEYVCQVNIYLLQGLSDAFVALLFLDKQEPGILQKANDIVAAYTDALERVLGAPAGSISLMEEEAIMEWFSTPEQAGSSTEKVSERIVHSVDGR